MHTWAVMFWNLKCLMALDICLLDIVMWIGCVYLNFCNGDQRAFTLFCLTYCWLRCCYFAMSNRCWIWSGKPWCCYVVILFPSISYVLLFVIFISLLLWWLEEAGYWSWWLRYNQFDWVIWLRYNSFYAWVFDLSKDPIVDVVVLLLGPDQKMLSGMLLSGMLFWIIENRP